MAGTELSRLSPGPVQIHPFLLQVQCDLQQNKRLQLPAHHQKFPPRTRNHSPPETKPEVALQEAPQLEAGESDGGREQGVAIAGEREGEEEEIQEYPGAQIQEPLLSDGGLRALVDGEGRGVLPDLVRLGWVSDFILIDISCGSCGCGCSPGGRPRGSGRGVRGP